MYTVAIATVYTGARETVYTMASERTEKRILWWTQAGVILTLAIQMLLSAQAHGALMQKVDDLAAAVARIEAYLDTHTALK